MEEKTKTYGVASLVCSIFGISLVLLPYIGLPLSIMAIVFSRLQKKIMPTGVATSGFVVGIVGTVLSSVMLLLLFMGLLFLGAIGSLLS